ncbi:MAG: uroporphyrinogen-III synthase, partial [Candidatus Solibacter usitatus]|nr:uroporphyrinogen-III synthase [Candidatus Solibacter usitatus]
QALADVRVASIGPITSAAARRLGLAIAAEAATFDVDGLIAAIVEVGLTGPQ